MVKKLLHDSFIAVLFSLVESSFSRGYHCDPTANFVAGSMIFIV